MATDMIALRGVHDDDHVIPVTSLIARRAVLVRGFEWPHLCSDGVHRSWEDCPGLEDCTTADGLLEDWADAHEDEADELDAICTLLNDLLGKGDAVEWEDDWYPALLVSDEHFDAYVRVEAEAAGLVPMTWPGCHVDWDEATEARRDAYQSVDFYGVRWWYR